MTKTEGNVNDLCVVNVLVLQFQMFIHYLLRDIYGKKWLYITELSPTYANLILFLG